MNIDIEYRLLTSASSSTLLITLPDSSLKKKALVLGEVSLLQEEDSNPVNFEIRADAKVEATAGDPCCWAPVGGLTPAGHRWDAREPTAARACAFWFMCVHVINMCTSPGVLGASVWAVFSGRGGGGGFAADSLSCGELWEKKS